MASEKIHFFQEKIDFSFKESVAAKKWLPAFAVDHAFKIRELNYIFCNDAYLSQINQQYLNHDTLTDIITFDHSETSGAIEGDIFISIERVKENAEKYNTPFERELFRVMVHGLLHLMGYDDKTPAQKKVMRRKEEEFLTLAF